MSAVLDIRAYGVVYYQKKIHETLRAVLTRYSSYNSAGLYIL